jgi:SAM-dependent methyltransferase
VSESPIDPVVAYDREAGVLATLYEQVSASALLEPHVDVLHGTPGRLALDVGAGSGRGGAYLASQGFEVVAAEPAAGMRREGQRLHPELKWIDDRLPDLSAVHRLA